MTTLTPGAQRYTVNGGTISADTRAATPGRPIWNAPLPHASTIKWFDPVRRFGFIVAHDGGGDIWFNWLTLLKNKIQEADALPDVPVQYSFSEPDMAGKQRSVVHMKIEA